MAYSTYQERIRTRAKELRMTLAEVSQQTRIHPAYTSRVLGGKADFSQSQLFAVAKVLRFPPEQVEELMLLRDFQCADHHLHKEYLEAQLQEYMETQRQLQNQLTEDVEAITEARQWDYYLDSITSKIHMLLTIPTYRHDPNRIIRRLNITKDQLQQQCELLESLGYIRKVHDKYLCLKESIHLDGDSTISRNNHINWRIEALNRIHRGKQTKDYHFTVNFTADEATREQVIERFKQFVTEVKDLVDGVIEPTELYHACFDLFLE